ncbi:MAG TPA: Ppx/GppA phosphatase family protein [Acetobacteraceae bacterium]|nr:Ppx/GppA phosphatase family protein [Acetobacteraceae bacterium]
MFEGKAFSGADAAPPGRRIAAEAFAALDLGTNNCRMLIGVPASQGFRVLDSFSRIVRLGEGLHESGRLSERAMERTIAALHACRSRLDRRPLRRMRAVATEACRRAENGLEFLSRARQETGIAFDVISPREEAELALESCASLLADGAQRALLFDIGGGSTEIAWVRLDPGRPPALIGYLSLPVGVVSLAERFREAPFSADCFDAMAEEIAERLWSFECVHCIGREIRAGGVRLLGTSGTVTTLAGVAMNLPRYSRPLVDGVVLRREAAERALAALRGLGETGLLRHPCVGPDRIEFVLPGCAIFAAIVGLWPAPEIVVADRGLREGMIMRMMRAERRSSRRIG